MILSVCYYILYPFVFHVADFGFEMLKFVSTSFEYESEMICYGIYPISGKLAYCVSTAVVDLHCRKGKTLGLFSVFYFYYYFRL